MVLPLLSSSPALHNGHNHKLVRRTHIIKRKCFSGDRLSPVSGLCPGALDVYCASAGSEAYGRIVGNADSDLSSFRAFSRSFQSDSVRHRCDMSVVSQYGILT